MARVNLIGGFYANASLAASAQVCLNLIPEPLPQVQGEPVQYVHLLSPGTAPFVQLPTAGSQTELRCLYTASNGDLITVAGAGVYFINSAATVTPLGTLDSLNGQVRIQDNGLVLVIVDGSVNGYYVTMPTMAGNAGGVYGPVTAITDTAWYGSITAGFLDTFLIFVQPGGKQWYISPANYTGNTTAFDPLYIASKTSYPDPIVGVAVVGQVLWIFGQQSTELWYDAGATDFPFQRQPSVLADTGCESAYSIATNFGSVFWLGRDAKGRAQVFTGAGNEASVISTYAISNVLDAFPDLSRAIGHCYQQNGHTFYVLTVQAADATVVYDITTQLWHQRSSAADRLRANCWASAYGRVFCGDFENGLIYEVSTAYTDECGAPIIRQRAFPHIVQDGRRAIHRMFGFDMQCGTTVDVVIDWSDDRGQTYISPGIHVSTGVDATAFPRIWRLGMTRDRVYRLTWEASAPTSLLGAYIETTPVAS